MPRVAKAKSLKDSTAEYHLAPEGMAGFVLANRSMSSNQTGEGDIRRALIEADLVDCTVALPDQLFYRTEIPVCLWFRVEINPFNRAKDARLFDGKTELSLVHYDMRRVATANSNERQEELGQFLTASPVTGFMASMFSPLPRTVRLLDTGAGALTADSSQCGHSRNCQGVFMWRDNPKIKPMK